MTARVSFIVLLMGLAARGASAQPETSAPSPLLVVLADTGQRRGGLPVFAPHHEAGRIASALLRGFPARLVRFYRMEQRYLHRAAGAPIEPAYLEFSSRQGGFPGFGFWLGGDAKPNTGYVDLYERRAEGPRFGGVDQIFPHELGHVLLRQLSGERPRSGSTQGHAIAVRTDPVVAFDEGFAEHFQVMALDDPEADPRTKGLLDDPYWYERACRDAAAYREAMAARWAPAVRARVMFPFWYSGDEQVWRYYAVKANAFARQPPVPVRLLHGGDPYRAYLLENVLPAGPADPPKTPAQMFATEGFVSTLFWRWSTSDALRNRYRDEGFYARFGVRREDVPPELNVYLKIAHAFYTGKPYTARAAIETYRATFPDEAADLDAIVRDVLLDQPVPSAPEIWLANADYHVGTRVFDQFRAAPRVHTFDLNAASVSDLVAVPGIDAALAEAIVRGGPYESLDAVGRTHGVSADLRRRLARMERDAIAAQGVEETAGSLFGLLWSFGVRALASWVAATAVAAALFRRARRCGWWRAAASGAAASLVTLLAAWLSGSMTATLGAAFVLFALPGLLLSLRRRPLVPALATTALAWLSAVAPAVVLVTPLF